MGDPAEQSRAASRFPYVAALLCAACAGAAGWLCVEQCLRTDIDSVVSPPSWRLTIGRYVRIKGVVKRLWDDDEQLGIRRLLIEIEGRQIGEMLVILPWRSVPPPVGKAVVFSGRAYHLAQGYFRVVLYADEGRFTGASIAGLVVGAMGVFVFGAALRHWLERRRSPD